MHNFTEFFEGFLELLLVNAIWQVANIDWIGWLFAAALTLSLLIFTPLDSQAFWLMSIFIGKLLAWSSTLIVTTVLILVLFILRQALIPVIPASASIYAPSSTSVWRSASPHLLPISTIKIPFVALKWWHHMVFSVLENSSFNYSYDIIPLWGKVCVHQAQSHWDPWEPFGLLAWSWIPLLYRNIITKQQKASMLARLIISQTQLIQYNPQNLYTPVWQPR